LVAIDGRYAVCMRVPSERPARGASGGHLHRLIDNGSLCWESPSHAKISTNSQIATLAKRDRVYRQLQSLTQLRSDHKAALLGRGFSEAEIQARGYRTLPLRGRSRCAREVGAGDPQALVGVPGFYEATNGTGISYKSISGRPGLLIPCRAPDGKIRGLRIRPDDSCGGKYEWFSSNRKPGGTGSGVHCHVARPLRVADTCVWIVEGEIKADLAAERLGAVVVSIPGVSAWWSVLADLSELLPATGQVVVALDSDWRDKPPVHHAMWNLATCCRALGYRVEVAQWSVSHKGLDDLLTAGLQPCRRQEIPLPEWSLKLSSCILATAPSKQTATTMPIPEARSRLAEFFQELSPCT
jgi:hypothetical protein